MTYVIYDKSSSAIVENVRYRPYRVTTSYKTMSAAKAALTRMSKKFMEDFSKYCITKDPQFIYDIAEVEEYHANIEKQVQRKNLMTGELYWESVNTPRSCSPSTELYWSM